MPAVATRNQGIGVKRPDSPSQSTRLEKEPNPKPARAAAAAAKAAATRPASNAGSDTAQKGSDVFAEYSAYYDLLYADKNYVAEADYIAATLRAADGTIRRVLEFGSGTGKHGRLLAARGFNVVGIERSEGMAAMAQPLHPEAGAAGGSFTCQQGDIRTATADGPFDAVISLFHVVSYLTSNADVLQTFENAARHLRPAGIFFFDVWHGPAVLTERPEVRIKRVENSDTHLTRIAEPALDTNASVVTVTYTMLAESKADQKTTRFGEVHRMHYFFPTEIDLLARQTGFEIISTEEWMTGAAVHDRSWGVAYVLRKSS
jgi:SAM-dependent methyltransferase